MEVVGCLVVGVLSVYGVYGLLDVGVEEGLECARGFVRGLALAGKGKFERLEATLARRGVSTPRQRARRAKVEASMPSAFSALAISLGSGLSLPQALRYVGGHATGPIRREFLRASAAMGCGEAPACVLDELVTRLDAPGMELVGHALKVSRLTGAPMGELLAQAAQTAGDRMALIRQLDVKTSQARMSARMVALMPMAMSFLLCLISADYREGVGMPAGMAALAVALVLNIAAAIAIRRIMRIEI